MVSVGIDVVLWCAAGVATPLVKFPHAFENGCSAAIDTARRAMYLIIYESDPTLDVSFAELDLSTATPRFVHNATFAAGYYFGLRFQP